MKALITLKSAINQSSILGIIALVSLGPVIMPHLAFAAELQTPGQSSAEVFKINVTDSSLLNPSLKSNDSQNPTSLNIDTVVGSDPLVISLDAYLAVHGSPLAGSASKIIQYNNWQRALGISLVESSLCVHTPKVKTKTGWVESYNCSGIGGGNYHIYSGYLDWLSGMNDLLNQPNYVNRPIEKFIHYYVQPGSLSWLYGVKKTEAQFADMVNKAEDQRRELAEAQSQKLAQGLALATFSEPSN